MGVLFCLGVVVRKQEETTISETKSLPSYRVFAEARQEQGTLLNLLLEEKTVRRGSTLGWLWPLLLRPAFTVETNQWLSA